jgi:hypothetical protein
LRVPGVSENPIVHFIIQILVVQRFMLFDSELNVILFSVDAVVDFAGFYWR